MSEKNKSKPYTVFISYSHVDEILMKELRSHLSPLRRSGLIDDWCDHEINAGRNIDDEIAANLDAANLILLLVSSDFISSEYCYSKEMVAAIQKHNNKESIVIPIIIRSCAWENSLLKELKALPKDGKAVTSWGDKDEAWAYVVKEIANSIGSKKLHDKINLDETDIVPASVKCHLAQAVGNIDRMYQMQEEERGKLNLTGFTVLDNLLGDSCKGKLVLVACRSGVGKTSFVSNVIEHQSIKNNITTHVFSLALSGENFVMRMFSSLGRVDNRKIRSGSLDDGDWPRLTAAVGILNSTNIFIHDEPGQTISSIYNSIADSNLAKGSGLIVIDSLQLLSNQSGRNDYEFYSDVTRRLKNIAIEFNVPVIVTVPLPSHVDERANKRPLLNDLKCFGGTEDNADVIIFLYRDEVYYDESPDRGTAEVIVAKNNAGPVGMSRLTFIGQYYKFENYIYDDKKHNQG